MAINMPPLPPEFTRMVELTCQAKVGGREVQVQTSVVEAVYVDPVARLAIEGSLRRALMDQILQQWDPKIHVRRH